MDILIRKTWTVDGVLTDVVSMVLADPGGTFGVKRNDTNATVVDADTAMTRTSAGTYEHTFTGAFGVAYTAYLKVVYAGATYYFERDIPASTATPDSLAITYLVLKERVGRYLGLNEDATKWRDAELADVEAAIQAGLRQFYWPPGVQAPQTDPRKPPPTVTRPHDWSFLRQAGTLTLTATQAAYALPNNFNLLVGRFTGAGVRPIKLVDEGYLRAGQAQEPDDDVPVYAAVVDGEFDATVGSRKQVAFVPAPDAAYELDYRYSIVPEELDATNIYPLGGVEHGETILQSCLAMAELKLHDQTGPHYQRFMERLSASMRLDMQGGQR